MHASLKVQKESEGTYQRKRRETKMLCVKSQSLNLLSKLGGKNCWRVVRMGRKVTTKAKMWEGIGSHNSHLKILHHWHYQSRIHFPMCNQQIKIVPLTYNAKVVRMKPCSLSEILHILKDLEYTLPSISHPEEYYFIYHLQTCFSIRFAPPMLNVRNSCTPSTWRYALTKLTWGWNYYVVVF